jgi:hypothetical protein
MEIWKKFENYNYFVSNLGRVKSGFTGGIMSPAINGGGYLYVTLFNTKGKYNKMIHRMVAIAFIENPENKAQVNHKDGDKRNNVLENLEWNTQFENMRHSVDMDLSPRGSSSYLTKLTEADVLKIRGAFSSGVPRGVLSADYGIDRGGLSGILLGRTWKHVGGPLANKVVKLTKEDIPVIRKMFADSLKDGEIAAHFGVARGTIQQIRVGKNWKNY